MDIHWTWNGYGYECAVWAWGGYRTWTVESEKDGWHVYREDNHVSGPYGKASAAKDAAAKHQRDYADGDDGEGW